MKNLKDILTTISGILIAFGGVIVTLSTTGIAIPPNLYTIGIVSATIGAAVVSYLTGKNPDGTVKTSEQVKEQMAPKVEAEANAPK